MDRRVFLLGGAALGVIAVAALSMRREAAPVAAEGNFEVSFTDEEWQQRLSPEAYRVLRHEDTEYPGTSPLLKEYREGTFLCAGCDLPLFDSSTKYESNTGWPSFYRPLENAVATSTDTLLGYERIEVHCRRCGGHLGHVFDDGPPPTGLRYCMNGVSLKFEPKAA